MAQKDKEQKAAAEPEATKPKAKPVYHVVTVEGDTLTVVRPNVQAATQDAAMDAVMDERPADQREGRLGAFLAGSLRFKDYTTETEVKVKSQRAEHTFGVNGQDSLV
jgi:hypothetical protein